MRLVVRVCALAAGLALLAPAAAARGAPHLPPPGQVFHGGQGRYDAGAVAAFERQSGKHPAVFQYYVDWQASAGELRFLAGLLRQTHAARARALLAIGSGARVSPRGIARGASDAYLVALNRLVAAHGQVTYLRPLSEMNNGANPYSAYDLRGRPRGPAFSTHAFRAAWRRTVIVLRGGPVGEIDARLRALRLPPLRAPASELPRPRIAFLWIPLSFGNPELARNHPRHWWPGGAWVDWVGSTWYSPHPNARAFERFARHRLWRRKPFAFAEYGVWGAERPSFIRSFFRFARSHPRVRMVVYFQSSLMKPEFRLSTHPRSRAELRRQLRARRYAAFAPEYR